MNEEIKETTETQEPAEEGRKPSAKDTLQQLREEGFEPVRQTIRRMIRNTILIILPSIALSILMVLTQGA